ncbi:MAG: TraR/DksA C4-type zinc finger protein [Deltaproteobacteria bacterium]|nr:TraR/DksA C4-type zinc finger protein [Deltaproteobacteria bacterium]
MRDDLDLNFFKKSLEERLSAIRSGLEAKRVAGTPVELDQSKVGRLSRMDAMQQQAMAQATTRRNELEQERIQMALKRLESGDYGYCVKCEEEIAEARLRVDPATLVCIDCARAVEKK